LAASSITLLYSFLLLLMTRLCACFCNKNEHKRVIEDAAKTLGESGHPQMPRDVWLEAVESQNPKCKMQNAKNRKEDAVCIHSRYFTLRTD